jgi:hypothetical protein
VSKIETGQQFPACVDAGDPARVTVRAESNVTPRNRSNSPVSSVVTFPLVAAKQEGANNPAPQITKL